MKKPPPRYAQDCAKHCVDGTGMPRKGDQWIHIWGVTEWVCDICAERYGRKAGIPTRRDVREAVRAEEARFQLPLG